MKLSIVIPVYNGSKTIAIIVDELVNHLAAYRLEIILVNDGSMDNSHDVCLSIFKKYGEAVIYMNLAKNFGEHNAVLAGLSNVTGDYAIIIDDDFQNPPEEIIKLVEAAVKGNYDVVYGCYDIKKHSIARNIGSSFNSVVANLLLNKPEDLYLSSFKCLSSFIVKQIIAYSGPFPYIDGLILRSTHNIGKVVVRHEERRVGRSGYTFRKLVRLWLNMFVNFSIYPLRVSTILGIVFSFIGGLLAVYSVIDKIIHPNVPTGITSIFVAILIFSGIQLLMLGLIGEYIGKQFLGTNQTPQYVIRQLYSKGEKGQKA